MALSNIQYDELIRQYNAKQFHNQHVLEEHISDLYGKNPRFAAIDAEISSSSVSAAKQIMEGNNEAFIKVKEHLASLRKEKTSLICSMGYPATYLETSYTCPDCKDTGYINNKRCHCFVQAAIDLVYTQSNIKDILRQENFNTFSYDYYSDLQKDPATGLSALAIVKKAVAECQDFISNFDTAFGNIFFYGESGIGKTFLSNCIAKELLDTSHSVIYFTAFQLFEVFEKKAFQKDVDMRVIHQNLFDCDLLIIDDLGTELANSFTTSQLFLCLNERLLAKKSTIISANLNMAELAQTYSERICSRIFSNYSLIKLFGDDIRLQKKLH